ncbi:MAG: alpha/beta fold hydrolase [Actinomycetes bacterium]
MSSPDGTAVRLATTTLHGHRIAYRVAGDPDLPVVLLVHGLTSSSATWEPVMPQLARHAHVIAPDLIGHGDSDKPRADYSLGAFATSLRDLLEQLDHPRVTIVGHSFGGGVAMQFAHQYYAHCERLALVASGGLGREVSWVLRAASLPGSEYVLPVIANSYVRDGAAAVARLLGWSPVRVRPSVREAVRGYAALADLPAQTAFVHTLRSVVEPGGQRVDARNMLYLGDGRPTLIVWGALDSIIPVSHAYAAHAAIPDSRLEIFEQARHFAHLDEPTRFADVLVDFLATTEPAVGDRDMLRQRLARGSRSATEAPEIGRAEPDLGAPGSRVARG